MYFSLLTYIDTHVFSSFDSIILGVSHTRDSISMLSLMSIIYLLQLVVCGFLRKNVLILIIPLFSVILLEVWLRVLSYYTHLLFIVFILIVIFTKHHGVKVIHHFNPQLLPLIPSNSLVLPSTAPEMEIEIVCSSSISSSSEK